MAITCSPTENLAINQCAQCWTPNQKLMALAAILCAITNDATTDCDADSMLRNASCYLCMSDSQMLQAIIGVLYQYSIDVTGISQTDIDNWLTNSRACFECVNTHQLKAMITAQICAFYNDSVR